MQRFIGAVNGYGVNLIDQNLEIYKKGELVTIQAVRLGAEELVKFLKTAKDVHLGWAQLQDDGDEVIYIYDKADDYFGYAINLNDRTCSEWGYAPFRTF
jgi:hypothetical protein